MVRKALAISITAVALVAAAVACALTLTPAQHTQASSASIVDQAKTAAVNQVIDASGVKGAVQDALMSHAHDIAGATGISTSQVQNVINDLDIDDWQATTLPTDAVENVTISGTTAGVPATLTTYEDPGYVSVTAYGQTIDLAVPSSAQQYLPLLALAA